MIRKIVTLPNSVLREKSVRIRHIDETIRQLASDMIETTLDWDRKNEFGAALAAIQIGEKHKLTVVRNNSRFGSSPPGSFRPSEWPQAYSCHELRSSCHFGCNPSGSFHLLAGRA